MRSKFKWIFTLLLALTMQFSFAQEKTVTGVVSDNAGPAFGANVVVEGTKRGTQTDMDGKYTIKVNQGETLVFSYIGMETQSIKVGSQAKINVKLVTGGAIKLDDVMISGAMGIKRKKDAQTNAQQQVKGTEIRQAANPNIIQSLAGKVSGLQINTVSNGVTPTTRIVLRGTRSLTGNSQALVVIDGAISSADVLSQLPPDVVESLNVIKGQQGSALYGEQGSNGVIVVTTKRGSGSKKAIVSLNSSVDFTSVLFVPKTQMNYGQGWTDPSGEEFTDGSSPNIQSSHTPIENGSWGPAFNDPNFVGTLQATGLPQADGSFKMLPWSPIKDNIKKFFKTGTILQNGVSVNMGDENGYSLLSANRQNTDFVVDGDKLIRNSFLFKGGKKMGRWSVDGSANYISQKTTQTDSDLFDNLLQTPVNVPVEQFSQPDNFQGWTVYARSPYWVREHVRYDDSSDIFNGTGSLGFELNKHINAKYTGNMVFTNDVYQYHNDGGSLSHMYNLQSPYTIGGSTSFDYLAYQSTSAPITSSYFIQNSHRRNYYGDLIINFDYDLSSKLNLKVNIGNNMQDQFFTLQTNGGTNLNKPGIYSVYNVQGLNNVITSAGDSATPTEFYTTGNKLLAYQLRTRRMAEFANVDLAYSDYLFFNMTARHEKSSVVNTSQFYPGAGVSFIATKGIDAMKNKNTLNYLKLYGSYVVTGNSTAVGTYRTFGSAGNLGVGYPFNSTTSYVYNTSQANPNITPEYVYTSELGANLGFFKNRITLDGSVYQSDTKNLITNASTSSTSGIGTWLTNIGSLRNRGMEIDLGLTPVKTKDFTWNLKASYTTYKTIVTSLTNDANEVAMVSNSYSSFYGVGIYAVVGEQFPLIKGTAYQRDADGHVIVNASGVPLTTSSFQNLGKSTPDYILGFTNNLEYKGLRLTTVLDFRTGNKFYSEAKRLMTFSGTDVETGDFNRDNGYVVPNSVQNTGTSTNPVYTTNSTPVTLPGSSPYASAVSYLSGNGTHLATAESYIIDGTALRMRELSLSYGLPAKVVEKMGLSSLRFGVNARNPFIILAKDNRMYNDPEASATSGNAQGLANVGQYPTTKSYGFSLNLTF